MLIFKETLPVDTADFATISLPYVSVKQVKAHILHINLQYENPTIWYQVDGDDDAQMNKFNIIAIGTGHEVKSEKINMNSYIGTLLLYRGTIVLHYFVIKATQ